MSHKEVYAALVFIRDNPNQFSEIVPGGGRMCEHLKQRGYITAAECASGYEPEYISISITIPGNDFIQNFELAAQQDTLIYRAKSWVSKKFNLGFDSLIIAIMTGAVTYGVAYLQFGNDRDCLEERPSEAIVDQTVK